MKLRILELSSVIILGLIIFSKSRVEESFAYALVESLVAILLWLVIFFLIDWVFRKELDFKEKRKKK